MFYLCHRYVLTANPSDTLQMFPHHNHSTKGESFVFNVHFKNFFNNAITLILQRKKTLLLCPQSYCTHSYWPYVRAGTQNNLHTGCFHLLTQVWLQQTGTAATKHQKTRAFHFEMVNHIPAASYLTANHTNINLWLSFNNVNNKATLSKITKQKMWSWDQTPSTSLPW